MQSKLHEQQSPPEVARSTFPGILVVTPPANETAPQLQWAELSPPGSGGGSASLAVPSAAARRLSSNHSSLSPPPRLTLTRAFAVPGETVPATDDSLQLQPGVAGRRSGDLSLPPLPSPTFSELFYLEGEGPRTPMPQIMLTPADGHQATFWGPTDDMLEPTEAASTPWTPTSMFNDRPTWQSAVSYHEPGYPDEIAVSVGDKLEVYKQYQDGWILGFNHTTKTKGIFPGGCLNHLVPHAGTIGGGGGGESGRTPSFLTSSSRQDSTSAMSFTSSASKWLYGPPDENAPANDAATKDGQARSRSRSRERTDDRGGGGAGGAGGTKSSTGGAASSAQSSSSRTLQSGGGGSSTRHQMVEVDAKRALPSARHLRLVHTWQRARKPILVTLLMIIAISLVLGLGLGFGKVRAPPERNATVLVSE
ncbi:hypothetical protein HDU87_002469 [Geranomyces variabilis]|uniref:SH3 domain-containing protein n=1 Tax=Geranomyces variabilis TaxID=109894 RepID=A0AAD5TNM5_9FUNG|nr:hypothetical protein HDU87_002469 [Geranomyces variabilis]